MLRTRNAPPKPPAISRASGATISGGGIRLGASDPRFDPRLRSLPPGKIHRGADLISEALPFGGLWYGEPNAASNAVDYAKFYSRSHDAVIRVYDAAGNVMESHNHVSNFVEP
jgi:hypothetical protein